MEGRIRELQRILATAEIIPPDSDPSRVDLGDTVVLMSADGYETYTIVGSAETDPGSGFISYDSPLGKSLLRHKAGDEVLVHAPAGDLRFRVVEVRVPVWE
ncbi:MAG: GreA/GreB family elongation factor [Candidatus Promineifilaceae bacterium]|nr:GreA/GreB family elongation factor [Candidatus Promineifilaceae bacterium]